MGFRIFISGINHNLYKMKPRILYIDHAYHIKTCSTKFLIDKLKKIAYVDQAWIDPSLRGKDIEGLSKFSDNLYDFLILFQISLPKYILDHYIDYRHGVFIPMYDGLVNWSDEDYANISEFQSINFSSTLHEIFVAKGLQSIYCQYFPKPVNGSQAGDLKSIFFWQRINSVNLDVLLKVLGNQIEKIHYHCSVDPENSPDVDIGIALKRNIEVSITNWFEKKEDLNKIISQSSLYFAPRLTEGIGMSFLEAMAMGRCVIAPNLPTMNEYIKHGETGFLYEPDYLDRVDIDGDDVRYIQKNAKNMITEGYYRFINAFDKILKNVFN